MYSTPLNSWGQRGHELSTNLSVAKIPRHLSGPHFHTQLHANIVTDLNVHERVCNLNCIRVRVLGKNEKVCFVCRTLGSDFTSLLEMYVLYNVFMTQCVCVI